MSVPLAESYDPPKVVLLNGLRRVVPHRYARRMSGPPPPDNMSTDGCTASPDYLAGAPLWMACVWHDWHYHPRSGVSRMGADMLFFWNLSKVILEHGRWSLRLALPAVLLYFMGVFAVGWVVRDG